VSAPARRPPLWLRIGFPVVAALVVGLLAELALQIADIPPGGFSPWIRDEFTAYRYAPGLDTRLRRAPEYDVAFRTNEEGMRDDALVADPATRVLLLGDSFTSGYGVERGEAYADLVERNLGVDVVNAGVGGWEIVHQAHYARRAIARYDPDLVVYALYLANDLAQNDEWESDGERLRSRSKEFPLRPPLDVKLLSLFRGVRYGLREREARDQGPWRPFPEYLSLARVEPDEEGMQRWESARHWLEVLASEVRSAGRELFVVTFPYRTVVEPDARERFLADRDASAGIDLDLTGARAHRILMELGVDFASLEPALVSAAAPGEPLYFPIDGHWNVRGHEVVAATVTELLRARLAALGAGIPAVPAPSGTAGAGL
jgi:hypothetical protein